MTIPSTPIPNAYWVKPGLFLAGEYPGSYNPELTRRRLQLMLEAGISTFIDLTRESELPPYSDILEEEANSRALTARHLRFAIRDLSLPSASQMSSTLDAIDEALAAGRGVYLHCQAGIGRTGTTVGCYLVRHGLSGEAALAQLAEWWRGVPKSLYFPISPETEAQAEFVRRWEEPQARLR